MSLNLLLLEKALKKRLIYPYRWHGKQNNTDDNATNFVYNIRSYWVLEKEIAILSPRLKDIARNRWYNFWSAQWVEQIFATDPRIQAHKDKKHTTVDFYIDNLGFDHKTTIFPRAYTHDIHYAKDNKKHLIEWLYKNQSSEQRQHYENRIFICLYDTQKWQHWKLKAEILLIEKYIKIYMSSYDKNKLIHLSHDGKTIYSDIIWVII